MTLHILPHPKIILLGFIKAIISFHITLVAQCSYIHDFVVNNQRVYIQVTLFYFYFYYYFNILIIILL